MIGCPRGTQVLVCLSMSPVSQISSEAAPGWSSSARLLSAWPSGQCCPPSWALGCTRDRALSGQNCSTLSLRLLQGSGFQGVLGSFSLPQWISGHKQLCGLQWTQSFSLTMLVLVPSSGSCSYIIHSSFGQPRPSFRPTHRSLFSLWHTDLIFPVLIS